MSLKDEILKRGIILKIKFGKTFRPCFQKRTTPNEDFLKKEKGKSIEEMIEEGRREKNAD